MLEPLAADIWCHRAPLRFYGAEIGRRMVVIRLPNGGLLVHSPAPLTATLRDALDRLGEVRHVVPSSRLHGHAEMGAYRDAWPGAALHAAPGLERKRSDLRFDAMLFRDVPAAWRGAVEVKPVEGFPRFTEIEAFHRPSRTLILGDLCYNVRRSSDLPTTTKIGLRLLRSRGLTPTLDLRIAVRLHRTAVARRSILELFEWPFERIVVGHGDVVEDRARDRLRDAFAWLGVQA